LRWIRRPFERDEQSTFGRWFILPGKNLIPLGDKLCLQIHKVGSIACTGEPNLNHVAGALRGIVFLQALA
jgi:hypothetical protein